MHASGDKSYNDTIQYFWWPNIKREVAKLQQQQWSPTKVGSREGKQQSSGVPLRWGVGKA